MKFLRKWMLVIAMVSGASAYLIYHAATPLHQAGPVLLGACKHIQPVLLFLMLFLTFCKTEPSRMKPHRWQWWLLLVQGASFAGIAILLILFPEMHLRIGMESLMLCLICPTATACAVVTDRLGGDTAGVLTYTILINLLTAVLVPLFVPIIHPASGIDFFSAFSRILVKVFPLLIMPCIAAWLMRFLFPKLYRKLTGIAHLSFYIWAVSLTLAILMSTRAIVAYEGRKWVLLEILAASLLSCIFQFWLGKKIGAYYDRKAVGAAKAYNRRITAGQALGQKNTVFGIWTGYTFLDSVTSLACGFYSIWHNCFNTWQLNRLEKK